MTEAVPWPGQARSRAWDCLLGQVQDTGPAGPRVSAMTEPFPWSASPMAEIRCILIIHISVIPEPLCPTFSNPFKNNRKSQRISKFHHKIAPSCRASVFKITRISYTVSGVHRILETENLYGDDRPHLDTKFLRNHAWQNRSCMRKFKQINIHPYIHIHIS